MIEAIPRLWITNRSAGTHWHTTETYTLEALEAQMRGQSHRMVGNFKIAPSAQPTVFEPETSDWRPLAPISIKEAAQECVVDIGMAEDDAECMDSLHVFYLLRYP